MVVTYRRLLQSTHMGSIDCKLKVHSIRNHVLERLAVILSVLLDLFLHAEMYICSTCNIAETSSFLHKLKHSKFLQLQHFHSQLKYFLGNSTFNVDKHSQHISSFFASKHLSIWTLYKFCSNRQTDRQGDENTRKIWIGKPERRKAHLGPGRRWENNINSYLKGMLRIVSGVGLLRAR